jgi:hypothetical protein
MSVAQLIETVQQLPDNEFLLLKEALLEQEAIRHLQPKRVIYMDLRDDLPEPVMLTPEEEEALHQ